MGIAFSRRVEWTILTIGVLLRVYLAAVNAEANDDHLAVIRIMSEEHRIPRLHDAWEGFQPKLYHLTVAMLWSLSPWESATLQVRLAQGVSCAAGIATLFVARAGLAQHQMSPSNRLLAFVLIALNPTLIGLNAQATNDSFVILFATISLVAACEFFRTGQRRAFVVMSVATVLATLSKGNGLVVFVAIAATLVHAIVRRHTASRLARGQLVRLAAGFAAFFLAATTVFGSYRPNWEDTGNPFAINGERAPLPHWFEPTYVYRPGTTSIADTYFTFRLIDLVRQPAITNEPRNYPLHRTSLWSQLYGRAHVVHFSQHPPSWKNTSSLAFMVARVILVVALLPTALLVAGIVRGAVSVVTQNVRPPADSGETFVQELLVLTAIGFLAFIVLYSLMYRDFATMKAEFLFPGILAYAVLFGRELDHVARWQGRREWLQRLVRAAFAALLVLYVVDIVILSIQLT